MYTHTHTHTQTLLCWRKLSVSLSHTYMRTHTLKVKDKFLPTHIWHNNMYSAYGHICSQSVTLHILTDKLLRAMMRLSVWDENIFITTAWGGGGRSETIQCLPFSLLPTSDISLEACQLSPAQCLYDYTVGIAWFTVSEEERMRLSSWPPSALIMGCE